MHYLNITRYVPLSLKHRNKQICTPAFLCQAVLAVIGTSSHYHTAQPRGWLPTYFLGFQLELNLMLLELLCYSSEHIKFVAKVLCVNSRDFRVAPIRELQGQVYSASMCNNCTTAHWGPFGCVGVQLSRLMSHSPRD